VVAVLPLAGRVALVTGLSRRSGIGHALVRRLLDDGAAVFGTGWAPHDRAQPWGEDPFDIDEFDGPNFAYVEADLGDPLVPAQLVADTIERFSAINIVIANHARSADQGLAEVTAAELDACWAVNARASVLLAQALDANYDANDDEGRSGGRLVLFTSGQAIGPMDTEIAYAVSKGAIHQMTMSLANAVVDKGITVNTINPGPVDTGYLTGEIHRQVADAFPAKRWGQPDDVARLVGWLVSDEAAWITGQIINSEGGLRRWAIGPRTD